MATATRASRRRLRSFWRPRAELTRTCCPSKSTHTGVTCGLPSGISVARFPNAGLRKRSRYFSGMRSAIMSSVRNFIPWKASSLYHGRCAFPILANGACDAIHTLVLREEVRHPWLRTGHWFRGKELGDYDRGGFDAPLVVVAIGRIVAGLFVSGLCPRAGGTPLRHPRGKAD